VWKIPHSCENHFALSQSFFAAVSSTNSSYLHCSVAPSPPILAAWIMKKKVILSLAVLLVVTFSLIFYFRQRRAALPAGPVPELLLLAPSDADSLVYVDLSALRSSSFFTQLLAFAPSPGEDPDYSEFVAATGFDYSRDLDRLLIATRPTSSLSASTTAIAEGRFSRDKIVAYSLRSGKLEQRNGAEVYIVSSGHPAKTISFTFLAPGRILLANSPALDPTVVRPAQDLPPGQHDRFLRVAGSALIMIGRVDASQENFSVFGFRSRDLKRALRDVRWFSLGARPDGDRLRIALEAECISANAARELAGAAEALRFLARVLLADPRSRGQLSPQAALLAEAILRNGEFVQNDQRVLLRFDLIAAAFIDPASSDAGRAAPAKAR
jgi:hypothetical protein